MEESELIARQSLKIAELEEELSAYKQAAHNIHNIIYCIGGPLNDNKLKYTSKQMLDFKKIIDELDL